MADRRVYIYMQCILLFQTEEGVSVPCNVIRILYYSTETCIEINVKPDTKIIPNMGNTTTFPPPQPDTDPMKVVTV